MYPTRRTILKGAGALPLLTGGFGFPARVDPSWYPKIAPRSPGSTTTHFDRSPFPRAGHVELLDAKHPREVKAGVPTDSITTLRLSAAEVGRPIAGLFNEERIVARAWPASENRIAVAELTY